MHLVNYLSTMNSWSNQLHNSHPKYLVRWPAVLADIVFEASLLQFWSPALKCPVDMQVRLVSPLSLAVMPLPFRPLVVAIGTTWVHMGTVDQVSRLYISSFYVRWIFAHGISHYFGTSLYESPSPVVAAASTLGTWDNDRSATPWRYIW